MKCRDRRQRLAMWVLSPVSQGSVGVMAFTAIWFLLSLGSYPVVEARIASLPLPTILLGFLLAVLLLNGLADYRVYLSTQDKRIFAAATFLAFWLLLVTAASSATHGYVTDLHQYVGLAYIFAFPFLALTFRTVKPLWLLWALLGGCVLALSIGYFRFFTLSGGVPSEHALGYWGIRYLPSTRNSDVLYAIVSSLLAAGLYTVTRARSIRVILIFVVIASCAAVILSLSRGAWFALISGYIAFVWFARRQGKAVCRRAQAIGVLVVLGVGVAGWFNLSGSGTAYDTVVARMQSIVDGGDPSVSNLDRLDLAQDAVVGILRYPAGVGVGNISHALGRTMDPVGNAENAWLTIGLEGGWLAIVAFSLLLLSLVLLIYPIRKARLAKREGTFRAIGTALIFAICSYLMFNYELDSLFLWSLLAVVSGIKRRGGVAISRQDIGADGGVQCTGHYFSCGALDSDTDTSSGRNYHC
jgi:hypothetical protein